jgi:hypothetical protein
MSGWWPSNTASQGRCPFSQIKKPPRMSECLGSGPTTALFAKEEVESAFEASISFLSTAPRVPTAHHTRNQRSCGSPQSYIATIKSCLGSGPTTALVRRKRDGCLRALPLSLCEPGAQTYTHAPIAFQSQQELITDCDTMSGVVMPIHCIPCHGCKIVTSNARAL